jgi:MFS family permease
MVSQDIAMDRPRLHALESSPAYPGWRVLLGAVIGLAFSPGPMIFGSFGLFASYLQGDFGWGRGQIMLGLTFFNVAGVLASPYTGAMIDRFGVRRILFPSLILFSAGFLAIGWLTHSLSAFYLVTFLWGALTIGTQSISYTKLIAGWFVQRRGLAIGIAAAGLGLGYAIVPVMVGKLLTVTTWQMALTAMAALILLVPMLVNLLVAFPRPADPAAPPVSADGLSLGEALRTAEFRIMGGAIFLASAALTGVVPHIALMTLDRGFATAAAAMVASTYGISTILGRVLVGWLADRFPAPWVALLFFAISAIGFLLAALLGPMAPLILLIAVALTIGLGFGAESDIIALFITRFFGQRSFGAIYGYLLAIFLIGASIGPALFGFGRDAMGSYSVPMIIAAAIMLLACCLLALLGRCPARVPVPVSAGGAVA